MKLVSQLLTQLRLGAGLVLRSKSSRGRRRFDPRQGAEGQNQRYQSKEGTVLLALFKVAASEAAAPLAVPARLLVHGTRPSLAIGQRLPED